MVRYALEFSAVAEKKKVPAEVVDVDQECGKEMEVETDGDLRESAYLEVWAGSTNTKQDVYYRPNGLNIRKCSASVAVILY